MHRSSKIQQRFMKIDGVISEIQGETGGITVVPRNQENHLNENRIGDQFEDIVGGENFERKYSCN